MISHFAVRRLFGTLALLAFGPLPQSLGAQQTFDLTLELVNPSPTCTAIIGSVDFGQIPADHFYRGVDAPVENFDITFNCTSSVAAATADFDGGLDPSGASVRRMNDVNGNRIRYNLRDPAGNTINNSSAITFPLVAGTSAMALEAFLSSQTTPSVGGDYSDQITVTFTF